jgi:precorrin-2 dehydrogenase/sirohydrochlorin ferrochelatase
MDENDGESGVGSRGQLLPLLLDMKEKLVVIFGGGSVGERKAELFSRSGPVRVVSQNFAPGLMELEKEPERRLELSRADLSLGFEKYLNGAFIVIPATSDSELNRAIAEEADRRGILVNMVEGQGGVVVPSLIQRGPVRIAISTGSPALSKYMRLRLEEELKEDYAGMARLLAQMRIELKGLVPLQKDRARIIREILKDELVWKLLEVSYEKAYMRARSHACQG